MDPEAAAAPAPASTTEKDRITSYSAAVIAVISALVISASTSCGDVIKLYAAAGEKQRRELDTIGALAGVLLMCALTSVMPLVINPWPAPAAGAGGGMIRRAVVTVLVVLSGSFLIATDTIVVILVNPDSKLLALISLPVLVSLASVVWSAFSSMAAGDRGGADANGGEAGMKNFSDFAAAAGLISFGVQSTVIALHLRNPGLDVHHPLLDLSVSYAVSIISLSALMISAMPVLPLLSRHMAGKLDGLVEKLRLAILAGLAAMAVVLAVEFLEGYLALLTLYPELIAVSLSLCVDYNAANNNNVEDEEENERAADASKKMIRLVGASVAVLVAMYAVFAGRKEEEGGDSYHLKVAMFLLLMSIVFSLSRLLGGGAGQGGRLLVAGGGVITAAAWIFPGAALLVAVLLFLKLLYARFARRHQRKP